MKACRSDGVMLRPKWPLASLDATFVRGKGVRIWASHDDFGVHRWSTIVGVNALETFALSPADLQGASSAPMVAWEQRLKSAGNVAITRFNRTHPLQVPA